MKGARLVRLRLGTGTLSLLPHHVAKASVQDSPDSRGGETDPVSVVRGTEVSHGKWRVGEMKSGAVPCCYCDESPARLSLTHQWLVPRVRVMTQPGGGGEGWAPSQRGGSEGFWFSSFASLRGMMFT